MSDRSPAYRAVIFDLGGVVLDSPLHAIARYERDVGIPENFINQVVATTSPHGGWARLERGEISMEAFYDAFEQDCREAGREISARTLMGRIAETSAPRRAMLTAIARIRERGLRVAALTNNWVPEDASEGTGVLRPHFDVFVESAVEGLRKPDPRIYELVCTRLEVTSHEAVFLDDIGRNLKPARAMGMTTIRVETPEAALEELEAALGFVVRG